MDVSSVCVVVGWCVLHCGALILAWATRLAIGSRLEWAMQIGYFAVMGGVGGAAWLCRSLDLTVWMVSAVTLIAMVLTAVIDFRCQGDPGQAMNQVAGR